MKLVSEVEAQVVVTARLAADGSFEARVSARAEYAEKELPGATASAELPLDAESSKTIKAAMEKAVKALEEKLGRRLRVACLESYKVSIDQGEIKR